MRAIVARNVMARQPPRRGGARTCRGPGGVPCPRRPGSSDPRRAASTSAASGTLRSLPGTVAAGAPRRARSAQNPQAPTSAAMALANASETCMSALPRSPLAATLSVAHITARTPPMGFKRMPPRSVKPRVRRRAAAAAAGRSAGPGRAAHAASAGRRGLPAAWGGARRGGTCEWGQFVPHGSPPAGVPNYMKNQPGRRARMIPELYKAVVEDPDASISCAGAEDGRPNAVHTRGDFCKGLANAALQNRNAAPPAAGIERSRDGALSGVDPGRAKSCRPRLRPNFLAPGPICRAHAAPGPPVASRTWLCCARGMVFMPFRSRRGQWKNTAERVTRTTLTTTPTSSTPTATRTKARVLATTRTRTRTRRIGARVPCSQRGFFFLSAALGGCAGRWHGPGRLSAPQGAGRAALSAAGLGHAPENFSCRPAGPPACPWCGPPACRAARPDQ